MKDIKKERERPEAYPKPSETDLQLKNQPEFLEPDPNRNEENVQVRNDFNDSEPPGHAEGDQQRGRV